MNPVFPLPRLVAGVGSRSALPGELDAFRIRRPLLISDAGLERAGVVSALHAHLPASTVVHARVGENPTCADADAAFDAYGAAGCDGIVALGGGSVLDTAKFVAAMCSVEKRTARELIGRSELVGPGVATVIAVPTTAGTGSESSPASGLHPDAQSRAVGLRTPFIVPRAVLCDAELVRSLPRRLIAATGIDALSHCLEGALAPAAHPIADAIALDGLARAVHHLPAAVQGSLDDLQQMMAASLAGGAAIHKGLGPVHAIALACGDQHLHHGALVAAAIPAVMSLLADRAPAATLRMAKALGLQDGHALAASLRTLIESLGLPVNLRDLGYRADSMDVLVAAMAASPFNRTAAYAPTETEYRELANELLR
jgi:alcohol dehydrogenase class IV